MKEVEDRSIALPNLSLTSLRESRLESMNTDKRVSGMITKGHILCHQHPRKRERELGWKGIWRKWPQTSTFSKRHSRFKKLSKPRTEIWRILCQNISQLNFKKPKTNKKPWKQPDRNGTSTIRDTNSNDKWFLIWKQGGQKEVAQNCFSAEKNNFSD